jgi:hypothetical protein
VSRRTRYWSLLLAFYAATGWAVVVVLDSTGAGSAFLGVSAMWLAIDWWQERRGRDEREATSRALREHRDPGPQFRAATTRAARETLTERSDLWWVLGTLAALTVACVVAAVLRDDLAGALPAVPLTVLAGVLVVLTRRSRIRAARWLADPPHPTDVPEARP